MTRGALAVLMFAFAASARGQESAPPSRPRQPTALAIAPEGDRAFVANRGNGSLSVVRLDPPEVLSEAPLGRSLSDLVFKDRGSLVIADEKAHEILVVDPARPSEVRKRIAVAPYPVGVRASNDGRSVFATSLWSRCVSKVDLETGEQGRLDLPFAPRALLALDPAGKLLVADAFGGNLAVVNLPTWKVDSIRILKAQNIAALAVHPDGRRLVISHQNLRKSARSTSDDIHWGFLVAGSLRWLPLDDILDPSVTDFSGRGRVANLGRPGDGGGDPAGLAIARDGTAVIAQAGVNQVAIGPIDEPIATRVAVGARPTAVAITPDGKAAVVANAMDDTLQIFDLPRAENVRTLPIGPPAARTLRDEGERLFFDARLSQEGWMSCHSCHTEGHTNQALADTLGDDSYGAPKRVPSLLGVAGTMPLGWNGKVGDLASQLRKSSQTTMRGRALSEGEVLALQAYLESLEPPPSADRLLGRLDAAAVERGRALFQPRCAGCHPAPSYTIARTYDVGLADEDGNTRFNPPSLRGVSQRDAFLHDGRARDLREVFTVHGHPGQGDPPSDRELADLLAFLNSL
ncbi:MAG: cytochrome c peroxidase [Isosphaeraceae bacterium]